MKVMLAQGSSDGASLLLWDFLAEIFHPETKHIPTCITYGVSLAGFPEMFCPLTRQQLLNEKKQMVSLSLDIAGARVSIER